MYSLRTVFSRLLIDTAPPFLRGHPSHVKRPIRFQTIDNTFLLSFLKTLNIGPDPENESATSRSAEKSSSTWANPATFISFFLCFKCSWAFAVLSSCWLMFRPGWAKDVAFLAVAQIHCWDSGSSWGCRRIFRYSRGIKSLKNNLVLED